MGGERDGLTGKEEVWCEYNDSGGCWGIHTRGQKPPHSHNNMADLAGNITANMFYYGVIRTDI